MQSDGSARALAVPSGQNVVNLGAEKNGDGANICTFVSRQVRFEFPRDLLPKVPYLETALSGRFVLAEDEDGLIQLDLNPGLLRPILDYVKSGRPRYLFTHLSSMETVDELFGMLDFLCVTLPVNDFSPGQLFGVLDFLSVTVPVNDFSLECRKTGLTKCYTANDLMQLEAAIRGALKAVIRGACDAAFIFAMSIYLDKYDLESNIVRNKIFVKLMFIMSHPETFCEHMRAHVAEVYNRKVKPSMTKKQVKILEALTIYLDKYDLESNIVRNKNLIMSHPETICKGMRAHVEEVYNRKVKPSMSKKQVNVVEERARNSNESERVDESDDDLSPVEACTIKQDKRALYCKYRLPDLDILDSFDYSDYDSDDSDIQLVARRPISDWDDEDYLSDFHWCSP